MVGTRALFRPAQKLASTRAHAISRCMQGEAETPFFEAVIVPHRSLSSRAQWRLLVAVGLAIAVSTTVSLALRAWPVMGFAGVELLLAAFLLRLNARRARASEVVVLGGSDLTIRRSMTGRAPLTRTLPLAWLRVVLDDAPGRVPRLLLRSRVAEEEIAESLGEEEKRSLAEALAAALHRWNHPTFDNPQTR